VIAYGQRGFNIAFDGRDDKGIRVDHTISVCLLNIEGIGSAQGDGGDGMNHS
jgi:hypothetical protein